MKVKKPLLFLFLTFLYSFVFICNSDIRINHNVQCGKISDYVYEDGNSNIIVSNRKAGKKAALTFDDGPSERYTKEILNILNKYNVKGTFFIIGENAEKNPELIKEMHLGGHAIGNHTYSHPNMRNLSAEQIDFEIKTTQKIITDITGTVPYLFRPPGGYMNNRIADIIAANNCKTVLWSWKQDTMDWKCPTVDNVVNTVISNICEGDIILFHDFNPGNSPTPEALEIIIPKLIEKGYELVTVPELF